MQSSPQPVRAAVLAYLNENPGGCTATDLLVGMPDDIGGGGGITDLSRAIGELKTAGDIIERQTRDGLLYFPVQGNEEKRPTAGETDQAEKEKRRGPGKRKYNTKKKRARKKTAKKPVARKPYGEPQDIGLAIAQMAHRDKVKELEDPAAAVHTLEALADHFPKLEPVMLDLIRLVREFHGLEVE